MKIISLLIIFFFIISSPLALAGGHAKKKPTNKKTAKKVEKKLTPTEIAENKRFCALPGKHRKALLKLDEMDSRLVNTWVEIVHGDVLISSCDSTWGVKARKDANKARDKVINNRPKLVEGFYARYDRDLPKLEKLIKRKQKEIDKAASLKPIKNERLTEIRAKELAAIKAEQSLYEDMLDALEEMNHIILGKTKSTKKVEDRLSKLGISKHGANAGFRKKTEEYSNIIEVAYGIIDLKTDIKALEDRKKEGKNWNSKCDSTLKAAQNSLDKSGKKIIQIASKHQMILKKDITKLESNIKRLKLKIGNLPEKNKSRDRYTEKMWETETELFALQSTLETLTKLADWEKL